MEPNRGKMYRTIADALEKATDPELGVSAELVGEFRSLRDSLLRMAADEDNIAAAFSEPQPSMDNILADMTAEETLDGK